MFTICIFTIDFPIKSLDFPLVSHGFPPGKLSSQHRSPASWCLWSHRHSAATERSRLPWPRAGKRKRESHGGSSTGWFYTWVTGGLYYIVVMMMANDDGYYMVNDGE